MTIVVSGAPTRSGSTVTGRGLDEVAGVADGDRHHRRLRVDARCVGQQRGVVDADVARATHEPEAVAPASCRHVPNGTVEHRWTVITLARRVLNVACIVARSDGRRTTGAPRYEGYTSVAPASSMSSARRARPWPSTARSRRVSRYVTSGSRRPRDGAHRAPALARDRRVVDGEVAPVPHGRSEAVPRVAEGERDEARAGGRAAERQIGRELLDLVHWYVVGDVDGVGEAGRQLDGRVDGQRAPDAPRRPERCRRAGVWIAPPQTKTSRKSHGAAPARQC